MGEILRAGALQPDAGDEVAYALQNRVLHEYTLDGKTGDGFRAQADRGDHAHMAGIEEGCALGGGVAQLILHALEIRRTGAVDLAASPVITAPLCCTQARTLRLPLRLCQAVWRWVPRDR